MFIKLDKERLYLDLKRTYMKKHKKSKEFFKRAHQFQVYGGSHNLRLNDPFPFYDVRCQGPMVTTLDGHSYVDFWQGHFANILGHNPLNITEALQEFLQNGEGLVTGFPGQYQIRLAELLSRQTGAEKIRFTTSGTLASMSSIMLAKSYTQRDLVLKIAGGWQSLYGINPDLSIFGKIIGGGMPVSAVAGRKDVLELCHPKVAYPSKVKFNGGTFSAHPASMFARTVYLQYLIKNAESIYPQIGRLGNTVRNEIERIFRHYGFPVTCTGLDTDVIAESSLIGVHFLHKNIDRITSPEQVWSTKKCDPEMREKIFKLAMLNEGVNITHGFGAVSSAHSDKHIQNSLEAVERVARIFLKYKI